MSIEKTKANTSLAADIRASFCEALAFTAGKRTKVKVHRVKSNKVRRAMGKQTPCVPYRDCRVKPGNDAERVECLSN